MKKWLIGIVSFLLIVCACTKQEPERLVHETPLASEASGSEVDVACTQTLVSVELRNANAQPIDVPSEEPSKSVGAQKLELSENGSKGTVPSPAQPEAVLTYTVDDVVELNGVHISRSGWASETTPMIAPLSAAATNWSVAFHKLLEAQGTYAVYVRLASVGDRYFDVFVNDEQIATNLHFDTLSVHFSATQEFCIGTAQVTTSTNILVLRGTTSLSPHIHSLVFRRLSNE